MDPDTLKNELSFGLTRGRVYLGKLAAALILGLALCGVLLVFCLGGGWLLLAHDQPENERINAAVLAFALLGALPLWCSAAGVCHLAAMNIRSPGAWVTAYYMMFFFGQPMLVVLVNLFVDRTFNIDSGGLLQAVLLPYSLTMPPVSQRVALLGVSALVLGNRPGVAGREHPAGMAAARRRDVR